ncbi:hypothetical protein KCV01_g23650, partial [Aureobasidium melanogenum]
VTEGRVRVSPAQADGAGPVELGAGSQVSFDPETHAMRFLDVDASTATSWRDNRLAFVNEPLDSVLANVNRYASRPIRLSDPALGKLTFTGTVQVDTIDSWVAALPRVFPYTVRGRRRVSTGAFALLMALPPAVAADGLDVPGPATAMSFAIAPQPLSTALLAWGKQANVQVVTSSGSVANWRTDGAQGVLTPGAALDELLRGTDLEREASDPHTVVVRQKPKMGDAVPADPGLAFDPSSVIPLATVDVRGLITDGGYKADSTRSATRTETSLSDVPQSVSVVNRDVIAAQQAVALGDVARYVAGVQYVDGYGGSPLFLIRGFDAGHGMTDGMPNGVARTEDLPPLVGIERVEVLRGPEAILGDTSQNNNFGGSINVVMKRPQADTIRTLTYSVGEYDGARLGVDLAGTASKDGSVTYRLVAAGQRGAKT